MFKPHVDRRYRMEEVDLQPGGSTITVRTPSDNPFESAQDVEVYTQVSGGMAGPDAKMVSRAQLRHPTKGTPVTLPARVTKPGSAARVQPGQVQARVSVASAHRPHAGFMPGIGGGAPQRVMLAPRPNLQRRSFMPGLGDDASAVILGPPAPVTTPAVPSGSTVNAITGAITGISQSASNILGNRYASQAAESQARAAAAQAQAAQAQTERARVTAMLDTSIMNMGEHKTLVTVLLVGAGVAIVAAIAMKMRKGKKGRR